MQEKEINNNKNSIYIRVRHGFSLLSWFCKRLFCRHMKSKAASDGLKVYAFFIYFILLFCAFITRQFHSQQKHINIPHRFN